MLLILALALVCLTSGIVNSIPQCAENAQKKEEIICKDVQYMKDFRGVGQKHWKHLKIINDNDKENQLEWDDIPEEFANLEHLDISQVGELILQDKGFENLPNLKALNMSNCKVESLKASHFADVNRLENLDASWNLLQNLSAELEHKFQHLEVANFSHNAIQLFETDGIIPKLRVLHLDFNELKSINLPNYRNLEILTISDNLIEKLTSNSFKQLTSMQELIIISSPLNHIDDRTFESMTDLKNLNLSANSLEKLTPDVFAGLTRLIQLDLNSNDLVELAPLQFQHLVKLQNLDISRNSLKSLNSKNFKNLVNLRKLYIYGNEIEEVKANTFDNLVALDTLDLSYNSLEHLDADVFGSHTLPRLRKLLLKSNNLKSLHPLAFTSLPFLQYLSLGFNELSTLDVRMFAPFRRLEKLHLGNNLIETISSDVLESLTAVSELLLDKNRLSFLSNSNATFEKLEKVSLEGNPWQCPCWEEMTKWLEARKVSYVRPHSPYFKGQKPLCVVTPVEFCVKDLRLVKEHHIEDIYNSG
ncbi:leucine-rich repeat-containing protein 15 [Calliphora vicina]|uniref:leucine-rich repeat-containing protein 15 n=1 Tax=Calliphora vicina TaxID=7373 RepID=UPI00325B0D61